jgi:hypothetical protein
MSRRNYVVLCEHPNGTLARWVINTAVTLDKGITVREKDGSEYRVLGPPHPAPGELLLVIDVEPL